MVETERPSAIERTSLIDALCKLQIDEEMPEPELSPEGPISDDTTSAAPPPMLQETVTME